MNRENRNPGPRVAVLDDYQGVALTVTDWSAVGPVGTVTSYRDHLTDADEIVSRLGGYDVIVAMRERTPFPRSLLERLPDLKLLITTGMRNNSFDLEAAAELGIVVSGTQLVPTSTVELTWALILAVARDTCGEDRRTRAGQWQQFVPLNLAGSTLGIVGLGKLGSQVANIAHAFGMEVLAWSPHLTPERAAEHHATRVEFGELLDRSQILTLHVPLNDGSRGLIGSAELRRLGASGYLINTSRGPIVDQDALVRRSTPAPSLAPGLMCSRWSRFRGTIRCCSRLARSSARTRASCLSGPCASPMPGRWRTSWPGWPERRSASSTPRTAELGSDDGHRFRFLGQFLAELGSGDADQRLRALTKVLPRISATPYSVTILSTVFFEVVTTEPGDSVGLILEMEPSRGG